MLLSASRAALARCCLWAFRPDVPAPPRVESPDASTGTARHAVLAVLVGHDSDASEQAPALWGCEPADWPAIASELSTWLPPDGQSEVAMYWHAKTDTARTATLADARAYDPHPGELPGTADLVRVLTDRVEVWEYKTGRQDGLEPASVNPQLAALCLMAARAFGRTHAMGALCVVSEDGSCEPQWVEYDSLDLDAIAYELRGLLERIPSAEPAPGPWCSDKWCPARAVCPETRRALVATPIEPLSLTIADADTCARVHVQIGLAEEFLESVKRARNEWLQTNPGGCELADGSVLTWAIEERESIELTPAAIDLLRHCGCEEAIEQKTSKAAIERAVKAHAPKGQGAELMRAMLAKLAEAGAIKVSQYGKPKARKSSRRAA